MNTRTIILLVSLVALLVVAERHRAKGQERVPASAEYSEAFCLGWNSAVQLEQQRFAEWRKQIMAGRGADDKSGIPDLIAAVPVYVLLMPLFGKADLANGKAIECKTPEPAK